MSLRCRPFGEWGLLVECDDNATVRSLHARLQQRRLPWLRALVPAYESLLVLARPGCAEQLDALATELPYEPPQVLCFAARREITLEVAYDGPDLADVCALTGLSPDEVIARHTAPDYTVAFLGFSPGFPYLLGLDPALHVPRLASPRTAVPAGSVGLGGDQTGVYPSATPGGWRLIGRTATRLFDPAREPAALLRPDDTVRFVQR